MQKTISILIAFLLLISNTQLTFGQHYCEGKVVEAAMMVGQEKMSCEPSATDMSCENESENTEVADCCTNVYHQIETDADYSGSHFQVDFNTSFLVAELFNFSFQQDTLYSSESVSYSEYLPPPLEKDIPVLFQTFLI